MTGLFQPLSMVILRLELHVVLPPCPWLHIICKAEYCVGASDCLGWTRGDLVSEGVDTRQGFKLRGRPSGE